MIEESEFKELERRLREWDNATSELCEWFNDMFKEPKPTPEQTKKIQDLVKKYQWDNGTMSCYVIPEIDGVH